MEKLRKKGADIQPVRLAGRQIARTFWGRAWCDHLEKFSDFANRLPRGRTYVRNGSVCHLAVRKGRITAKVSGSDIYDVEIKIKSLPRDKWRRVRESCVGQVGSLLELLQGRLSDHVMTAVTDRENGLFPLPEEIRLNCSCPDWATMCKHVAAVLYGVGARLDEKPELLFVLRGVDHQELIAEESAKAVVHKAPRAGQRTLREGDISEVFGIELAPGAAANTTASITCSAAGGSAPSRSSRGARSRKPRVVRAPDATPIPVERTGRANASGKRLRRRRTDRRLPTATT
jgi:uncharacterized Zn finger protein